LRSLNEDEVLLEFHRVGNAVKVTAVDPHSLVEATIVGDPAVGEQALGRAAIRKLRYVLERRSATGTGRPNPDGAGSGGRGTVV